VNDQHHSTALSINQSINQSIYLSAVDINRIDDYYSSEKHSDGLPEKQRSSKLAAHNQLTYKNN